MSIDDTKPVQNEQFGHKAENTDAASSANANVHDDVEDFDGNDHGVILSEPVEIPEELRDHDEAEGDELIAESEHSGADYSNLTKEQLISTLKALLAERPVEIIRDDVENIKVCFYKKHKAEIEQMRQEFVEKGGKPEDFKLHDKAEEQLKELILKYKEQRRHLNQQIEQEKVSNLSAKMKIIDQIKELASGTEAGHDTYNHFRELQKQWRNVGPVPQKNVTDLYESYNHNVEKFYDFLKINKELRDLDLKKNLEQKIQLCEKAEALLLEPSVVKAFRQLQEFHVHWREIGPVTSDKRTEVWERFKAATSKINKFYQDYFENLKAEQKKNLNLKTPICEKAEEIIQQDIKVLKEWDEKSKAMIELQQLWRTIGFAPRKENNRIYQRFHAACNDFFKRKKEFYTNIKDIQSKNYQLKLDICILAESFKDSTEWKKATDEIIHLQKRWKLIGPVPRKHSDIIWKRFRAACDTFFDRKQKHFSSIENSYDENLNKKLALIEEIKNYQIGEDVEKSFDEMQEFQRRFAEIGFVPLQKKEEVMKAYREAIDTLFNQMKIDDSKRKMLKFKNKIDSINSTPKAGNKMRFERDKYITKLRKLENDIKLWENNIGFFAKSKNAESMIQDVNSKIEAAKQEIKLLEDKIHMIDNTMKDDD